MDNNKKYQIKIEQDKLIFTTTSFKTEKTSVLHKGTYTKEFSSMLFASAVCIFAYAVIHYLSNEIMFIRQGGLIHFLAVIFIFIAGFVLSRKFLFGDKCLKVVFNKASGTASISRQGIIKKKLEEIPLDSIKSIAVGSRKFVPDNIDGIKFVEKISLQHGIFVPGLGDEEEFITLSLRLTDGSERIIYAGKIEDEPYLPLKELERFLGKKTEREK